MHRFVGVVDEFEILRQLFLSFLCIIKTSLLTCYSALKTTMMLRMERINKTIQVTMMKTLVKRGMPRRLSQVLGQRCISWGCWR